MKLAIAIGAVSLALAGGTGFLTAQAISQTAPEKTVTIDLKNGEPGPVGPPGPAGPRGPAGGTTCPDGYVFGRLIVNHPGGQATVFVCMTPDSD